MDVNDKNLIIATILVAIYLVATYVSRRIANRMIKKKFHSFPKDERHSHYWIENEVLRESYHTNRGTRHRYICDAPGREDTDNFDIDTWKGKR